MSTPFYLTTTIPYVNAEPHIGFALEMIQADARVRLERLLGNDVYFLAGTDENSLKNVQAAEKAGRDVNEFVAEHAEQFLGLKLLLNLSFDDFIRTTQKRHFDGAQKLWSSCKPDDMYKKTYKGLYCVGCEVFFAEEELVEGKCPDHDVAPEEVEEENYFFKLSKYQDQIENLLGNGGLKIYPEFRKNEMLAFVKRGLEDFSISRSRERAHGWGVPVPGDDTQIMYVWFDALSNYINALGYGDDEMLYRKFWLQDGSNKRQVSHVLGKGVARFHLVYWIGMLLSANIPLPTEEFVHGYITVNGQKMSKSTGNALSPYDVVLKYGTDAFRYYMLGAISSAQDGDFSEDRFEQYYTAHLANGIGNLTSRILTMLEKYADAKIPAGSSVHDVLGFWKVYTEGLERYQFDKVVEHVQSYVSKLDGLITETRPWEKAKAGEDVSDLLYTLAESLRHIALALLPIIPASAEKILTQLGIDVSSLEDLKTEQAWGRLKSGTKIQKGDVLFPRLT